MLRVEGLKKKAGAFCLGRIDLFVKKGEYFVLLGPSGAGKTLFLELLAGFRQPDSGKIFLSGRRIDILPIQKRQIGYLCQGDTLFPHLTVRGNIYYGLKIRKIPQRQKDEKVAEIAEETGISHLLDRKIDGLSGGERQRVALARMLVLEPACLLLDEPLTGMDQILKQDILGLLFELHSKGRTFIHVTHDPQEAIAVASRLALMERGLVTQEGQPIELLSHPETEFAARFAGIRNFFSVEVLPKVASGYGERVPVALSGMKDVPLLTAPCSLVSGTGPMFMVLDQGQVEVVDAGQIDRSGENTFEGVVKALTPAYRGHAGLIVDIGFDICASVRGLNSFRIGSKVLVWWPDKAMKFYKKAFSRQKKVTE